MIYQFIENIKKIIISLKQDNKANYRIVKYSTVDSLVLEIIDVYFLEKRTNYLCWTKISIDFSNYPDCVQYYNKLIDTQNKTKLEITYL